MGDDTPRRHSYNLRRSSLVEVEVKQETIVLSDGEDDGDVDESLGACGGWSPQSKGPVFPITITSDVSPSVSPTDSNSTAGYPQSATSSSTDIASSPPRCPSPEECASTPLPTKSTPGPSSPGVLECAICLQTCVHPARLPCSHIFCFLCLKGIAFGKGTCALCRRPIPPDYLDNPDLLPARPAQREEPVAEEETEKYAWYYEGRHGGWWAFEERMSDEIEDVISAGVSRFETLICGRPYEIDTKEMIQYPTGKKFLARKLLRSLPSLVPTKGVAGIRNTYKSTPFT